MSTFDEAEEPHVISKSQRKRDALEIQDLGRQMVQLKPQILESLPLDPATREAILAAKTLRQGALKRQIQYIGKCLRQEEDLLPLRQALAAYLK